MPNWNPLSSRQREVLTWIRDGCPEGVWTDFTYKTTSYSLRDRGLALVSKKGGIWRAEITPQGDAYLDSGRCLRAERSTPDGERTPPGE